MTIWRGASAACGAGKERRQNLLIPNDDTKFWIWLSASSLPVRKSTARAIGATAISEQARALEQAGNNGNVETLRRDTPPARMTR